MSEMRQAWNCWQSEFNSNDYVQLPVGWFMWLDDEPSSSRVGVLQASAFRFVSWTVCSPYPTLNLRRPSFSSRRCTHLEQSSAAYHICSGICCLLLSLEDILLRTLLPVITIVVPAKWHVDRSYLLTYVVHALFSWKLTRGDIDHSSSIPTEYGGVYRQLTMARSQLELAYFVSNLFLLIWS